MRELRCGEMVAVRDWHDGADAIVCGRPAGRWVRWSDGGETYVCDVCAHGHLRRATAAGHEVELV